MMEIKDFDLLSEVQARDIEENIEATLDALRAMFGDNSPDSSSIHAYLNSAIAAIQGLEEYTWHDHSQDD